PVREQGAVALVEGGEAVEGERRRAAQLDPAEGGALAAELAKVALDPRETVAPGDRPVQGRMDDLRGGRRDDAGGEGGDAGQEAVAGVRSVTELHVLPPGAR